jgi:integrase
MRGLSLLIYPSGARSWIMRFRRPEGRPAKLTLGPVDLGGDESASAPVMGGLLTLAGARQLAADVQRRRALGRDVVADYRAEIQRRRTATEERARSAFGAAAGRFIEEHARPKTRRWPETARLIGLRPSDLEPIHGGLAERWWHKPVGDITAHDIYLLMSDVRRRGVPGLTRRSKGMTESRARAMHACLSKFFSWLIQHQVVETNPCEGVRRPAASPARERVLTDDEIRWLWSACDQIGEPFGALVKLLLATGQRLNEIARLTRAELGEDDKRRPVLMFSAARTKNKRAHVVPLSPLAQQIIGRVRKITSKSDFTFTTNGHTPVSGFSKIKRRLDAAMLAVARAEMAKAGRRPSDLSIPSWRLHDLRRTVASGLQRLGIALPVTERVLNHVSGSFGGIVGVYQRHAFTEEKRAALEAWASLLGQITTRSPTSDVIRLRG